MKRQYSRQQIEKTIRYWTKRLHLIDEERNALIDALEHEFGHDVVFQTEFEYSLNETDLKKIFKILNAFLFKNALDPIQIAYWPESKIIQKMNAYEAESDGNSFINEVPAYGVFCAIAQVARNSNGKVTDAKFIKPIIMMNLDRLKKCIFIFAISCICHEMIHYYDNLTNEYLQKYIRSKNTNEAFDSHDDAAFQEKAKEANCNGLDVVERYGMLDTFNSINNRARMKLFLSVGEDEEDHDVERLFDGHTIDVFNKKTGVGCIMMLD